MEEIIIQEEPLKEEKRDNILRNRKLHSRDKRSKEYVGLKSLLFISRISFSLHHHLYEKHL